MAVLKALAIAGAMTLVILGLFVIIAWIIPVSVFLIIFIIVYAIIKENQSNRPPY